MSRAGLSCSATPARARAIPAESGVGGLNLRYVGNRPVRSNRASVVVPQAIAAVGHAGARELANIVTLDRRELLVAVDVEIRAIKARRAVIRRRGAVLHDRGILARALARDLGRFDAAGALVPAGLIGRGRRAIPVIGRLGAA